MEVVILLLTGGCLLFCLILSLMTYLYHGRAVKFNGDERLDGKTVIVTGGSGAIGKEIAIDLATRGAKVIIASRDMHRGQSAVQEIQHASKNTDIRWCYLDLANLLTVRDFANHIIQTEKNLDILINNAGVAYVNTSQLRTKDGYDTVFIANYLGHFLLTYLLLDLLKASAPARIVNVSSIAHTFSLSGLDFKITEEEKYGDWLFPHLSGYDNSKLAMVLHAKALTRILSGTGVTSYSVHPGVVIDTGMWLDMELFWPGFIARSARFFLRLVLRLDAKSAAQTPICCAVSKELEGISGKYYNKCQEGKECTFVKDERQARLLWYASMILTGCKSNGELVSLDFFQEQLASHRDTSFTTIYKPTKKPEENLHPMQRA